MNRILIESIASSIQSLRSQRGRAVLCALSVALGAGSITLMVSLAQSGVSAITHGIEQGAGNHLIFIANKQAKDFKPDYWDGRLPTADADALRGRVPGLAQVAFTLPGLRAHPMIVAGATHDLSLYIGSAFRGLVGQEIGWGADLPSDELHDASRVVLLGQENARSLFGSEDAALGQSIIIFGHRYTVIGVTRPGPVAGFPLEDFDPRYAVYITATAMIKGEGAPDDGFIILQDDGGSVSHEQIIRVTNAILQQRHHYADDIEFNDFATVLKKFEAMFLALYIITGLVASVSLVIAGAGIMNVLLASIRQRVSEIGIRRALGATHSDIRAQFIIESALLGLLGGMIGVAVGLALVAVAAQIAPHFIETWKAHYSFGAAGVALTVSLVTGIFFGLQPARKAAELDVVECLRGV